MDGASFHGQQRLAQPKGNLIIGPFAKTEFYASWGKGLHSNDVRCVFGTVAAEGVQASGVSTSLLASTTGVELGMRSNIIPKLQLQIAVFQQDFGSELTYNADTGQDEAGAPSRRQGIEVGGQYHPFKWLELNADLAFSKPHYHTDDLAAYGLGPWSGGLQRRRLGTHSLDDGHQYPLDGGYSEWNLDVSLCPAQELQIHRKHLQPVLAARMRQRTITAPAACPASRPRASPVSRPISWSQGRHVSRWLKPSDLMWAR
jgi:hypothetical protein